MVTSTTVEGDYVRSLMTPSIGEAGYAKKLTSPSIIEGDYAQWAQLAGKDYLSRRSLLFKPIGEAGSDNFKRKSLSEYALLVDVQNYAGQVDKIGDNTGSNASTIKPEKIEDPQVSKSLQHFVTSLVYGRIV